jgi:hypothetical protein
MQDDVVEIESNMMAYRKLKTKVDMGTREPRCFKEQAGPSCCVITKISSAQGDKNSASSTQDWSHSWHRIKSSALKNGQKTIQMIKNSKALYKTRVRARARNNIV